MTETPEVKKDKNLQREAYTEATSQLRDAHRGEFNNLMAAAAAKRGIDWKPRLTAEQRAEKELEALLTEHPHLVSVVQKLAPSVTATG